MARRDIPEINAGSMADIAFLLLIFFLVTTTMDRDKAYVRPIPKKVEIPIEPPPIQERDICAIIANSSNELMVRKELVANPDDISDLVLDFFRTNEKLTTEETAVGSMDPNFSGFNFPFYNRFGIDEINRKIAQTTKEAEDVEEVEDADPVLIQYYWAKVKEWEKKKKALKLYGKSELPEISPQAHIRIEVQIKTGYVLFARIQSEIEEALFELRDDAAQRIWGFGYGRIVTQLGNEPTDAEYLAKKALLELLYPARIIEVTPKK
jgi:predicted SnoaL-like aldol condensation-catalyzing enzyme